MQRLRPIRRDHSCAHGPLFAERAGMRPWDVDSTLTVFGIEPDQSLVKDTGMTHAGAWHRLAEDITRFTVQASVTCAVFRGSAKTHILDRKEFKGNLYDIYQEVMTYFQAKLNSALIPHAQGRDERLELPESALREAVVNAIAHRDYRSTANVQIYIFQDKVEIVTPGGLPPGCEKRIWAAGASPKPLALQYALSHEVSRADRQRHPPNSRRLPGARRCGTGYSCVP